ncbi:hypothetical protein BDV19DRAFT_373778 [Aspergillus venezuelensis]
MTSQEFPRPRFYRSLQSLKDKSVTTIAALKPNPSALSLSPSESRSRFSRQSINLTRRQNQLQSPVEQKESPQTIERTHTIPHIRTDTLSTTITSLSSAQTASVASFPPTHPTSPPNPEPISNNPTTSLLSLTAHIQTQTTQARHLFTQTPHLHSATEKQWIESTIADTEDATRDVLRLTESFRIEEEVNQGRVSKKSQLRWIVRDSRRAKEKRERLVMCHTSLMAVLGRLQDLVRASFVMPDGALDTGIGAQGVRHPVALARGDTVAESTSATVSGSVGERVANIQEHRRKSSDWDLSVHLQDAGMQVVVQDPVYSKKPEEDLVSPMSMDSARESMVKSPVESQEEVESTQMDQELVDMLSWRWGQRKSAQ